MVSQAVHCISGSNEIRFVICVLLTNGRDLWLLSCATGQTIGLQRSRDPTQERMQNVLFLLYHHLSHDANAHLLPRLLEVAARIGPHASRMLRVLSRQLFATQMYKTGKLIARGAYATVSQPPDGSVVLLGHQGECVVGGNSIRKALVSVCYRLDLNAKGAMPKPEPQQLRAEFLNMVPYGISGGDVWVGE